MPNRFLCPKCRGQRTTLFRDGGEGTGIEKILVRHE